MSPTALLAVTAFVFQCVAGIPQHMQFQRNGELIEALHAPTLRLNVKGGDLQTGDPLVLWPCGPQMNELFQISEADGVIRLVKDPGMCLQAAGGVVVDAKMVVWPCPQPGFAADHEQLVFEDGRIKVKNHRHMCVNVKGGNVASGAELVLFHCHNDDEHGHELFTFDNGLIKSTANPELHFNIKGGDIKEGGDVLLYHCQPAPHELFSFDTAPDQNTIRLTHHQHFCVNAEGGLSAGNRLIMWPCSKGSPTDNEQFKYDSKTNTIHSVVKPNLGFNVKGGLLENGAELVLWNLNDEL